MCWGSKHWSEVLVLMTSLSEHLKLIPEELLVVSRSIVTLWLQGPGLFSCFQLPFLVMVSISERSGGFSLWWSSALFMWSGLWNDPKKRAKNKCYMGVIALWARKGGLHVSSKRSPLCLLFGVALNRSRPFCLPSVSYLCFGWAKLADVWALHRGGGIFLVKKYSCDEGRINECIIWEWLLHWLPLEF